MVQLHFAIVKGTEKCRTANFRYAWLTTEKHKAWSAMPGVREDLREIQVVCHDHETPLARVFADFGVLG
jgi:hypothetical protein